MDFLPLAIFPRGSLAESVITTVWVGAMVVIFFNSRFGWSLSGIIVPGYLVPLLILKPVSVGVILLEACLTYGLARLLFVLPARFGIWGQAFGRDRFFALILLSIVVRLVCDAWLLPQGATWLGAHLDLPLAWSSQLHSFGLIILALIANQFWKPGFVSGLRGLTVTLGLVWLLVVFLLIPLTNFTISNVAYLYEDMAGSITGSPKAYMILVVAAFFASRMNLNYGWEYNGILVPGLLALLWYQPRHVLVTAMEALVILFLARVCLRLPILKNIELEGGRKLMFFFSLGFAYKMLLGHGLAFFDTQLASTDFFGFGYMLSTLMAMKMHQKEIPLFLTRTTLQVSLGAALVANFLGYGLTLLPRSETREVTAPRDEEQGETPLARLHFFKQELFRKKNSIELTPAHLRSLFEGRVSFSDFALPGYRGEVLEHRYLFLSPIEPEVGRLYVFDTLAKNPLTVSVPFPLLEKHTMAAGWRLAQKLGARLAVFGDGKPLHLGAELRVRGDDNRLTIAADLPIELDLVSLEAEVGALTVFWGVTQTGSVADAELFLSPSTRFRLLLSAQAAERGTKESRLVEHRGVPNAWLMARKQKMAKKANERNRAPSLAQLRFFDGELLRPLLALLEQPTENLADQLTALAGTAATLGYGLHRFSEGSDRFLVLAEYKQKRGRGTYVFRLGEAEPLQIQVPRPLSESGTMAYGLALFDETRARSLLLAGDHVRVRADRGNDPLLNEACLFNLVYQADLRARGNLPLTAVQVRASGNRAPTVVLGGRGEGRGLERITEFLANQNQSYQWADGKEAVAGYEASRLPQARYLEQTQNKQLAVLWLGPSLRENYRARDENPHGLARFQALDIPTRTVNLASWLPKQSLQTHEADPAAIDKVRIYLKTRDVLTLFQLQNRGWSFTRVRDKATRQAYLVVRNGDREVAALANLDHAGAGPIRHNGPFSAGAIRGLINQRACLTVWGKP